MAVLWRLVRLCNPGLGLTAAGKAVSHSGSSGAALLKSGLCFCFISMKCLGLRASAHINECQVPYLENL